jgi:hypothetical protein
VSETREALERCSGHVLVNRIEAALNLAELLGQTDGNWHKAWVIDQMVQSLTGKEYAAWVGRYCTAEGGPYTWDKGIAP